MGEKKTVFTKERKNELARLLKELNRTARLVGRLESLSFSPEMLAELPDIPDDYLTVLRAGKSPIEAVEAAGLYAALEKIQAANVRYCSELPVHLRTTFKDQLVFVSTITEEAYLLDDKTEPYSWVEYDPAVHGPLYRTPVKLQKNPTPLCPDCGRELEYMPVINVRKSTTEHLHACSYCGGIWQITVDQDDQPQSIHRYFFG